MFDSGKYLPDFYFIFCLEKKAFIGEAFEAVNFGVNTLIYLNKKVANNYLYQEYL